MSQEYKAHSDRMAELLLDIATSLNDADLDFYDFDDLSDRIDGVLGEYHRFDGWCGRQANLLEVV